MGFKGKKLIVLATVISLFLLIIVAASSTVMTLDPSLPSNITENVNLTLSANFSNEEGFFSSKNLNQFSDGSESKNLTFKGENQKVYVKLPKSATVTSAMFEMIGYEYSDYVYFSFENENFVNLHNAVVFFGKSGVGMVEPDIFIKNIPLDFTATQLELKYHHLDGNVGSGPLAEFSYSIQICPLEQTDMGMVCNPDSSTTLITNFTVSNHEGEKHIILFDDSYYFTQGTNYKLSFTSLSFQEENSLYRADSAEGDCLWDDNQESWDECSPENLMIYLKLYPEPLGPYNPWFFVGDNEEDAYNVWFSEGDLTDVQTTSPDLSEDFNYYLSNCEADQAGNCLVPIVFSSETIGVLGLSNLEITYQGQDLCQVCLTADGECDAEWADTITEYVDDFSGMCSYYWDTVKYNNSYYEVGFRIEDSNDEEATASTQILLNRTLELYSFTLNSSLVKVGNTINVTTRWNWIVKEGDYNIHLNNITCELYVNDNLSRSKKWIASPWCDFVYFINVSDVNQSNMTNYYPPVTFYVKAFDQEKREGITPTMLVKVGVNQTLEANTPAEFNFTSAADADITLFVGDDLESIIVVEPKDLPLSQYGLNSLKGIDIEVDEDTKAGLLWGLIKIFYNESELLAANTPDESTLKVYYHNESAAEWQLEPNQGVNIESNYVWVNVTHFSTYGVFGETPPPPPKSSGNGGGGDGSVVKPKPANATASAPTPSVAVPVPETTAKATPTPVVEEKEETDQTTENLVRGEATTETSSSSGITGAVVGLADTVKERPVAVGMLLVSVAVLGFLVYQAIRKKKTKEATP